MEKDMKHLLIVLFLSSPAIPREEIRDEFDMVEVNHLYNEYGGHMIDQLIFYNWDREERKMRVEAWVLMKNCRVKTEQGEKAFKKARDEYLEKLFRDPVAKQKARGHIQYKGDYIGGPNRPRKLHDTNLFVTKFQKYNTKRIIFTKFMRETETYFDPERENKRRFPENQRLGFTKIPDKPLDN